MAVSLPDRKTLRELVIANRILVNEGVLDAFGHVSIRHPESPDHYVLSWSTSPETVTEDDFHCYTLDGTEVTGDERPPFSERAIHGAIYEARPDVMAVCHNHAPSTIPFGATGVPLRPIFHLAGLMGTDIPVWDIADDFGATDMLVRTMDQGRSLARTLGPRRVALMRGHGGVVVGPNVREVLVNSVYMERSAELQLKAISLGQQVHYLSPEEAELTVGWLSKSTGLDRSWGAWRRRVGMEE